MSLSYSDINLIPNYSTIESRDSINTETELLGIYFKSPAVPANMATTISFELAEELSKAEYFYILHRFYSYEKILEWIYKSSPQQLISISVGVKSEDKKLISDISNTKSKVDYVTIDIAHGHHILVKEMIEYIKRLLPETRIIAGNVMTERACIDLKNWGADAIKVGLSQGKGCSTYNQTGVGGKMFSTILKCAKFDIPIIADGGIREVGDFAKSLVAGATMSMAGSVFAALKNSPAETKVNSVCKDLPFAHPRDIYTKVYYGSASEDNGNTKYIEGRRVRLPMVDKTYLEYLNEINEGLRSTMSYAGINNIKYLKNMQWE